MNRALIVIDVQESFGQLATWELSSAPDIATRISRLVDHARDRGDLVVWVLHSEPGSGDPFDPASGHVRLMDGLEPRPSEPVLTKYVHNAFTTTQLGLVLTQHEVGEVTICGIKTEQCCETTARLASDLGYQVVFVIDATATTPLEHPKAAPGRSNAEILSDPLTLQTDEVIRGTAYALAGRFADVVTIDELVGAARADAVAS